MKKLFTCCLISIMLFSMVGCGDVSSSSEVPVENTTNSSIDFVEGEEIIEGTVEAPVEVPIEVPAPDDIESSEVVEIVNPITLCETLEEAEELAGFSMTTLDLEGYELSTISVISSEEYKTIEVFYWSEESKISLRKTNSPINNSGNYNNYNSIVAEPVEGQEANIMYFGNDNKFDYTFFVIDDFGYTISVFTPEGTGVSQEVLKNYINMCK